MPWPFKIDPIRVIALETVRSSEILLSVLKPLFFISSLDFSIETRPTFVFENGDKYHVTNSILHNYRMESVP